MSIEDAIEELKDNIKLYTPLYGDIDRDTPDGRLITALEMAIRTLENHDIFMKRAYSQGKQDALSQEPCDDAISRELILKQIEESVAKYSGQYTTDMLNMWGLFTQFIKEMPSVNLQPCEDAISRILKRMWNCRGKHTTSIDKVAMEQIIRDELPSVTQKSESVTEFADRCRECGARYGKLLEQKSGKWLITPMSNIAHCSECDYLFKDIPASVVEHFKYCPNCGAKMENEE